MSVNEHRAVSPAVVTCVVITVSDTRTLETDTGGAAIVRALEGRGHLVWRREIVTDDLVRIRDAVNRALDDPEAQAVIATGGTGIARRDVTSEAVSPLIDKPLDGFGELFRVLSYEQIGAAAILSRAFAGAARGKIVIALPGSEAAVTLAMEKLVGPELAHMVREAGR
jgi:molybdenum cofactor biosynthesis protein B